MRIDIEEAGPRHAAALAPALASPEARQLHHLYTPEQIAFVLQRERARADRHDREFSLVMFRSETREKQQQALLRLAKIVLAHARTTDEAGHYDKTSVCVVLPDTHAAGAWHFAQRVCDSAKRQGLMPVCVVYTYPSAWFPRDKNDRHDRDSDNGNGHDGNGHDGNGHNGNGHRPANGDRRGFEEKGPSRPRHLVPLIVEKTSHEMPPTEIPIQRMETLLLRQTPWWKRAIDLIGASMALTIFSPLMLVIAILIKWTSPGPVIFTQKRAGLGGKPFNIYKFRSMTTDAEDRKAALRVHSEQDGPAFKMAFDPRVTRIGKFIRSTSLDELPQLWNVIKGDMSLVGPRPLPVDEANAADQWHQRRLEVTPGLTCIWQIKGRSRVTFDEWVRMDISYIRRRNMRFDLSLIAQTIPAVLLRRGAR